MEKRLTEAGLDKTLQTAAKQVAIGAIYKHYKGNRYRVTGVAILEANNETCVIYQALCNDKLTFVRPLSVWREQLKVGGKLLKRFSLEQE